MKRILMTALLEIFCGSGVCFASITSKDFVDDAISQLQKTVDLKADNDAVVHLMGDESVGGNKSFTGNVTVDANIDAASNTNHVATTKWTNEPVAAAKVDILVGSKDSTHLPKFGLKNKVFIYPNTVVQTLRPVHLMW